MSSEEEENDSIQQLEESVKSCPDDPSLHFNLGVLLWEKGEEFKEKAVQHFMISVKLNPQNGAAFRYLGHYYSRILPENQRAIKCYQRAVMLNPDDSDSGEAICDLLEKGGKESLIISVCGEASEKSARAFWAFRRLGYLQAHQKKWSEAIQSLQHAIRGFPTCADLWETLGLAYQSMGMFTSALKSYGRAVEIEDSRVFALVQSGNISLMLGSFRKGVEQYEQALRFSPQNVSAHYGLASALVSLARECTNSGAFKWGATLLEEAYEVATRGTSLASNMSCSWKLLGDIQLMYARRFPWTEEIRPVKADETSFISSIGSWKRTCFDAATHASRFYQRSLHLAPWKANLYADVAIATDLSFSLKGCPKEDTHVWSVPEKMCLGGILLEGHNDEFWISLGCLSDHNALKQHAFIRGLQLDVSLAVAWAYLGKLFRQEGKLLLAQKAFDRARSIDPSLALPWAGMAADAESRKLNQSEAYECCLMAVQISPRAEVQIGLAKISMHSRNLSSSEVFGAIQQALLQTPEYPESHNLNGLVCESRSDYINAVTSYRLALCAIKSCTVEFEELRVEDICINLARSLFMAGYASDAVEECEKLRQRGQLSHETLQIYALSLYQLGKNDKALSIIRELASTISSMDEALAAASITFICRLLYYISGHDSTITTISKMPKEFFRGVKITFVVSAIHFLGQNDQLQPVVSSGRSFVTSREEIIGMHILIALGKIVKHVAKDRLAIQKGVSHLRKALHMYPSSDALRNLLSYLLLSSQEGRDVHLSTRCPILDIADNQRDEKIKSSCEIVSAAAVACYGITSSNGKYSFPTCTHQKPYEYGIIRMLQKFLHQEPWNINARYLLTLNYYQKAREERFPIHICSVLNRLTPLVLPSQLNDTPFNTYQYFQLLLCAAEINLQQGNKIECFRLAKKALDFSVPSSSIFFAHLLLCRAYALENDFVNLSKEYRKCLELRTESPIGWICLKFIEARYKLASDSTALASRFEDCTEDIELSWNMWRGKFDIVQGLIAMSVSDFVGAEEFLMNACSLADEDSCPFLIHGVICMELATQKCESHYISRAIKSLNKAKNICRDRPLPMISLLLAQAEASLGSKEKWEKNLRDEWLSWPPELRPAELFFQMHLLTRQLKDVSNSSSLRLILRAIHTDPSCLRYWKFLQLQKNVL